MTDDTRTRRTASPRPDGGHQPYRVVMVCLGNICRSPMAEVVLRDRLVGAGMTGLVEVDSAGTGGWHVGRPADPRTVAALARAGYDGRAHRARQIAPDWLAERDLVVAMDGANLADLRRMSRAAATPTDGFRLLRDWDREAMPGAGVPDPYHGTDRDFDEVLGIVERSVEALVPDLVAIVRGDLRERGA